MHVQCLGHYKTRLVGIKQMIAIALIMSCLQYKFCINSCLVLYARAS